jgi:hypothetical protein
MQLLLYIVAKYVAMQLVHCITGQRVAARNLRYAWHFSHFYVIGGFSSHLPTVLVFNYSRKMATGLNFQLHCM